MALKYLAELFALNILAELPSSDIIIYVGTVLYFISLLNSFLNNLINSIINYLLSLVYNFYIQIQFLKVIFLLIVCLFSFC